MLPKGILFDLDDTILAFDAVANPAWREVCARFSGKNGLPDAESLFNAIRDVRRWYWSDKDRHKNGRNDLDNTRRKIVCLALEKLGVGTMSLGFEIADAYTTRSEVMVDFFPGAKETLESLKSKNIALALVTNGSKEKQRAKIERFGLERFFKVIIIEGELGHGKPEPVFFQRALKGLNLNAEKVWCVGDNLEWDVAAPQSLGIYSIWHDSRKIGLPAACPIRPDRIIHNISEQNHH